MKLFLSTIIIVFTLPVCSPVSADLLGMVPGRSAYLPAQPNLSVEVGANWYTNQLQWAGTRINFKPGPRVVTYLDISLLLASEVRTANDRPADFLGAGFGGGIMFAVPDFFVAYDVAFNASFHSSVIDEFEFDADTAAATGSVRQALRQSQWSAGFMVSPLDPLFESGTSWYSSLGFVSTTASSKPASGSAAPVDYEPIEAAAIGFGMFKPMPKGRLYAGLEWLPQEQETLVGVGASFSFR